MVIILKVFSHHFNSFIFYFFFYLAECLFCYLQELLILLAAEQKSKSESKQLVMSFQWPISMKLRAKTSRLRQCQPSEFISEGQECWGEGAEEGQKFLSSSRGARPLLKSGDSRRFQAGHTKSDPSAISLHWGRVTLGWAMNQRGVSCKKRRVSISLGMWMW